MSRITPYNPSDLFPPYVGYAHAVEVPASARTLYISGLNGYESDGTTMPPDFEGQARLVWRHLGTALAAADMTYADLVQLRFYPASPADDPANVELIRTHLGDHVACRTVVVQQLLEPEWRIEVEAVAARVGATAASLRLFAVMGSRRPTRGRHTAASRRVALHGTADVRAVSRRAVRDPCRGSLVRRQASRNLVAVRRGLLTISVP